MERDNHCGRVTSRDVRVHAHTSDEAKHTTVKMHERAQI